MKVVSDKPAESDEDPTPEASLPVLVPNDVDDTELVPNGDVS